MSSVPKDAARKWRRLQAKQDIAAALTEIELTDAVEQPESRINDELPQ